MNCYSFRDIILSLTDNIPTVIYVGFSHVLFESVLGINKPANKKNETPGECGIRIGCNLSLDADIDKSKHIDRIEKRYTIIKATAKFLFLQYIFLIINEGVVV
jgi:hypothetical protein